MRWLGIVFLALLWALPARAEIKIQEVTSPGGIKAWLVEEPSIPFTALDILPRHHRSHLEDGISGTHEGVAFALAEATLSRRTGSSNGKDNYKTVFHGLLFVFEVKKRFSGMAIAVRDAGPFKKLFDTRRAGRIELEDPRFEKLFDVHGTDQVEARYLFTPTLMERLVALGETIGDPAPHIAFDDGRLLVAARVKGNWFEPGSIFVSIQDHKAILAGLESGDPDAAAAAPDVRHLLALRQPPYIVDTACLLWHPLAFPYGVCP